jgi:BioD-like phosphotransacetylase family protein
MANLVVASTRKSSGKTAMILGLARALGKSAGYIKPLGDRLLYKKKRLWDYDAAVVLSALGSNALAEEVTIGFERSKLRYMYDEEQISVRLKELSSLGGEGRSLLFVECGSDLMHGSSVHLDALSVARCVGGKLLLVAGGGRDDAIVDDVAFVKRSVDTSGVEIAGVIANKVMDPDDFRMTQAQELKQLGVPLLGVVPMRPELGRASVRFLADCLFARVISGEGNLDQQVHHIFVGAMSADAALRDPSFRKENKLIITSGDRSDMILAALETSTAGIVLANNLLPPANIVSRAAERNVPILLVPTDTFQAAKQVDDLETLITREDREKLALLEELVRDNVAVDKIL